MNKQKVSGIFTLVSAVLALGAVKIWAPVCEGTLELANGGTCMMKCHYYGQVLFFFGLLLLAQSLVLLISKQETKVCVIAIVTGILILIITNSNLGIGVCAKDGMMCHSTALWGRISAVVAIVSGIVGLFGNIGKTPQAN